MTPSGASIRDARAQDLEGMRQLLAETWHDTFDDILGHDEVVAITRRWHAIEALRQQLGAPGTSFLVAVRGETLVGHAAAQARQPPVLILSRLYVLPSCQRQGIGTALLNAAIRRHPSSTTLRLLVEAANTKGLSFYRRHGFAVHGEEIEGGLKALRMEKALG
jgi:ribosomal protein S18 acetylase RimI-like enzyme